MQGLSRRLKTIERNLARNHPAEDLYDRRWTWPRRFAAHNADNADILARYQVGRGGKYPNAPPPPRSGIDIWDVIGTLGMEAGIGPVGDSIGFPPSPTPEQQLAINLMNELGAAAEKYEQATGDKLPFPGRG